MHTKYLMRLCGFCIPPELVTMSCDLDTLPYMRFILAIVAASKLTVRL